MPFDEREIQVDVILERAAAADRVRLGRGDLFYRKHQHALGKHQRFERREGICEERHFDAVDKCGEFVGIVDERSDGRVREHRAEARQERALDLRFGEQVEIDRYAVTDLEGERGTAGKIEA